MHNLAYRIGVEAILAEGLDDAAADCFGRFLSLINRSEQRLANEAAEIEQSLPAKPLQPAANH